MPDNLTLDAFPSGQALTDVGGDDTTGLDHFVGGQLYLGILVGLGTAGDPFAGEAGSEFSATTTVITQLTSVLPTGSELLSATFLTPGADHILSAGAELVHVVTIATYTSTVTESVGSELYAMTNKFVPGDVVPGSMARLGVGV